MNKPNQDFIDSLNELNNEMGNNPLLEFIAILSVAKYKIRKQREKIAREKNVSMQHIQELLSLYEKIKNYFDDNKDIISSIPQDKLEKIFSHCGMTKLEDLDNKVNEIRNNNKISNSDFDSIYECMEKIYGSLQDAIREIANTPKPFKKINIIVETNDNFGHTNLVYEADVQLNKRDEAMKIEILRKLPDDVIKKIKNVLPKNMIDTILDNLPEDLKTKIENNASTEMSITSSSSPYSYINTGKYFETEKKCGGVGEGSSTEKRNKLIKKNITNFSTKDNLFTLTRIGVDELKEPIYTEDPVLSVSIFKNNLNRTLDKNWGYKYLIPALVQIVTHNYFFPNGSVRVYIDHWTLEDFKYINSDDLKLNNISNTYPSIFYENDNDQNKINNLLNILDNLVKYENVKFENAYQKIIYYYFRASQIYEKSLSQNYEEILKNKHSDLFVYMFDENSQFVETNKYNYKCHITDGYIGQLMRYICLRQSNYNYKTKLINRNKHYIWRDAHSNISATNDYEIINQFNNTSKSSNTKIFNLIPSNTNYVRGWHDYVRCPADRNICLLRSAIAGHVQMANFTDNSKWMEDLDYILLMGIAFTVNPSGEVILKKSRNYQIHESNYGLVFDYYYGIEEYLFANLFLLDNFKEKNIYFNDGLNYEISLITDYKYTIEQNVIVLLFNYLKNELSENFTMVDLIKKVEALRYKKTDILNSNEKKWLQFLLAIYPTKYFIRGSIFSAEFFARAEHDRSKVAENSFFGKQYNKSDIENHINTIGVEIYNMSIENYTYDKLKEIGIMCNTPMIRSGYEWCRNPYFVDGSICLKDDFFSGFYNDDTDSSTKYGFFKNPEELDKTIQYLDTQISSGKKISLVQNLLKTPEPTGNAILYRGGFRNDIYQEKYIKYKNKYLKLKNNY
jgi:hypothetical protein